MMFQAEKNSIWYSTSPKGILLRGNKLSLDPGLIMPIDANLYIRLLLLFCCKCFIACTANPAKFAGLELITFFRASSKKARLANVLNNWVSFKPDIATPRSTGFFCLCNHCTTGITILNRDWINFSTTLTRVLLMLSLLPTV